MDPMNLPDSWRQHGANLGLPGPRWDPCWPHEPCYLGLFSVTVIKGCPTFSTETKCFVSDELIGGETVMEFYHVNLMRMNTCKGWHKKHHSPINHWSSWIINSLWPSEATWWQSTGSTLAQVMALLPDGTKLLTEPMLTYHQWSPVTITWGQFYKRYLSHQSIILVENYLTKTSFKSPRASELTSGQWDIPYKPPGDQHHACIYAPGAISIYKSMA